MELTRKTDYAVRMLALLASSADEVVSVRELAEKQEVPYAFARNIQRSLVEAGLTTTRRGASGGATLARDAETITLLEVVEAVQGDISCSVCRHDQTWCGRVKDCKAHIVWAEADVIMRDYLGAKKLSDIAG